MAKETPNKVKSWLKGLDTYWFGHGSPTTLGLFRIIMSSLIFVNLCMILVDFDAWFTQHGFTPQDVSKRYMGAPPLTGNVLGLPFSFHLPIIGDTMPRVNFLSGVYNDNITLAFYLATMVVTLLCALGLWTRLSSILMAIGIVSLHHRNGLILHGGDTVIRIGALYIAMAPSGAACSVDRLIGIWKGRIQPGPVYVSVWVQRLIAYNTALIYFTTFWHKYGLGSHWRDMTATWYPARLHEFDRFPVPEFLNNPPFIYFSTFVTLATELALGTLVFYRPLRKYVLLAGVFLHAYIDYSMNIPLFSYVMVTMYIGFYDGVEVEAWARRLGQRLAKFRVIVSLPERMRFRLGPGAAINAMDPLDLVDYTDGSSPAWEAVSRAKPVNPFRASLFRSVGAWPIGAVPYLWRRLLNKAVETAPTSTTKPEAPQKVKIRR